MRTKKDSFRGSVLIHKSSAYEKLICLGEHIQWGKLLLGIGKNYNDFLSTLIGKKFFRDAKELSIGVIANSLKLKTVEVSKYINQIYDDLYLLNTEQEEPFRTVGIKHRIYFKHYDNRAYFHLWLPQSPREYEQFNFFFIKAMVGTNIFWVKSVEHGFENGEYIVTLSVDGEMPNKYRDMLIERALFENTIHFNAPNTLYSVEIDKMLNELYYPNSFRSTTKEAFDTDHEE